MGAGNVARIEEIEKYILLKTSVWKGKRSLERLKGKWEDNIKMDLKEVGWECGLDSSAAG
jgi:hypothetical protein